MKRKLHHQSTRGDLEELDERIATLIERLDNPEDELEEKVDNNRFEAEKKIATSNRRISILEDDFSDLEYSFNGVCKDIKTFKHHMMERVYDLERRLEVRDERIETLEQRLEDLEGGDAT